MRTMIASAVLLLAAGAPALADDACPLRRVAALDMTIEAAGRMLVPMKIGDRDANMLIDTGGINSMLNADFVKAQKLSTRSYPSGFYLIMFGGLQISHYAIANNVDFGGLKADTLQFAVIPGGYTPAGQDGLLAPDILRSYDVDFDFANARFSLFSPDHCPGKVNYWSKTADVAEIPIEIDQVGHIRVPITVDGQRIDAALDTGAYRTTISLETMRDKFDIGRNDPNLKPLGDSDPGSFRYPFKSLSFGGVTVTNPDIVLTPNGVSKMRSLAIIGMGILRQLHLYIAYKEKKLYVTAASAH